MYLRCSIMIYLNSKIYAKTVNKVNHRVLFKLNKQDESIIGTFITEINYEL